MISTRATRAEPPDLDADQRRLLELDCRRIVVVAPPGTGKTFCSVYLAVHLSRELKAHQRVLLLTFSNLARAQLHGEARRLVPPGLGSLLEGSG